jgi:hypothetical protein
MREEEEEEDMACGHPDAHVPRWYYVILDRSAWSSACLVTIPI